MWPEHVLPALEPSADQILVISHLRMGPTSPSSAIRSARWQAFHRLVCTKVRYKPPCVGVLHAARNGKAHGRPSFVCDGRHLACTTPLRQRVLVV